MGPIRLSFVTTVFAPEPPLIALRRCVTDIVAATIAQPLQPKLISSRTPGLVIKNLNPIFVELDESFNERATPV